MQQQMATTTIIRAPALPPATPPMAAGVQNPTDWLLVDDPELEPEPELVAESGVGTGLGVCLGVGTGVGV